MKTDEMIEGKNNLMTKIAVMAYFDGLDKTVRSMAKFFEVSKERAESIVLYVMKKTLEVL